MINKEFKNTAEEIETLTADDEKLRQMLGSLKKVGAPKNFDFHLKARVANAVPNSLQKPFLLPWLRYVLPLSVIVLLAGFAVFNLSFSTENQVADSSPKMHIETENAPLETVSKPIIDEPTVTSVPANKSSEVKISVPEVGGLKNKTAGNSTKILIVKNSSATRKNKRENDSKNDFLGTLDSTSRGKPVISQENLKPKFSTVKPPIVEQNRISLREILTRIGIEADYVGKNWKIVSIKENSLAMRSDMKVGDLIEAIDDKKLSSDTVFLQSFTGKVFRILRDGRQIVINLNAK